jgi:hypothetical protein
MNGSAKRKTCFLLSYFFLSTILSAQVLDRREIVRQARESYYSLKNEGVSEFRCDVIPDWDPMFKNLKTDPVFLDQVLPILKRTQFRVLVGPTGSSTVSHESETAPPTEEVAERVRGSVSGIEQILTGFFHTWSALAFNLPFPDVDSEYQVEDLKGKLNLTYKEATASVATTMTHDFAIDEMKVKTPDLEGAIRPQLSKNKKEFHLIGYDATFKATTGPPQQLTVKIDSQTLEGFELPSKVRAAMTLAVGPVEFPFVLTNCQIKKR